MSGVDFAHWLPAVLAVAAWPAGVVIITLGVLVLAPRGQQAAVLSGIAEVVRAARTRSMSTCTDCVNHPVQLDCVNHPVQLEDSPVPDTLREQADGMGGWSRGRASASEQ